MTRCESENNQSSPVVPTPNIQPTDRKKEGPQVDALLLAYKYIFESVQTDHETAQIQAKGIETNATAQNRLIAREADFAFLTGFKNIIQYTWKKQVDYHAWVIGPNGYVTWQSRVTTKMVKEKKTLSQTQIDEINKYNQQLQSKNMEISALRGVLEDQLTVLRQSSQVKQTNLNSTVDYSQQSLQQGSSLLQMLTQLTNQISRI